MKFTKQPLSISGQIERLKKRGLFFHDEKQAAHNLSYISYYRLRAYTFPFQDDAHGFIQPISFEEIINLYMYDSRLRMLVFHAIEKIEVALRTKIIYEFSLDYGSHWFENPEMYRNYMHFNKNINSLYKEIDRSTETFLGHYKKKYTEPEYPPSWMSLEVISLGLLSKLFTNLKKVEAKHRVTKAFGLPKPEILESWMHSFAGLRNICAHHSRLWNRRFTIKPVIPYNTTYTFLSNKNVYHNKLYLQLSCINYFLRIIDPDNPFLQNLKALINDCEKVNHQDMGFPKDWQKEALWQ